jgi:hypothetical protein
MRLEAFIRYGSLWTLVLGVLSLAFAIRNYRRQVNAQIFFEIAGRYHDMLQVFPINEWIARYNRDREIPVSTPELTAGVLRYLAIVHFAFVLHELRYLSKDLWRILQAEHGRTLIGPLFVREWKLLRDEFTFFPTFITYVDAIQSACGHPARPRRARLASQTFRLNRVAPPQRTDKSVNPEFPPK